MAEYFDENEIARQAREWTKEDVIQVIKSWQMADEFFQEEHIGNRALLHKDLKGKAPLIEPNLRRNLGKWST
ncbi:TPA: hypothetical protein OV647_001042 [Acinetobacter baumannii]|nr:hypothetical protein [Acinetobacter baumannii]